MGEDNIEIADIEALFYRLKELEQEWKERIKEAKQAKRNYELLTKQFLKDNNIGD